MYELKKTKKHRQLTLKQKQAKLKKFLEWKEKNGKNWAELEDALVISKYSQSLKIKSYIAKLEKFIQEVL